MWFYRKKARHRSNWRMTTVNVFAPAKINLTLHVVGQRDDGYHELDSIVAFASIGDRLTLQEAEISSLTVEGPEATGVPADMDNLALRAASLAPGGKNVAITLEKNLPAASGIGGGSSDAAAAFRGMLLLGEDGKTSADTSWAMPNAAMEPVASALLALGADVPMCLLPRVQRVQGIGEQLAPISLPQMYIVLANPRIPIATPQVFQALTEKSHTRMPAELPDFNDATSAIEWLGEQRNDLEVAARKLVPQIGDVLAHLAECDGAGLARMSGSGATCFALFSSKEAAIAAAENLVRQCPSWWVAGGTLGNMVELAAPTRV